MKSTLHNLSALLAVSLYILLAAAQEGGSQHVPSRCMCLKSLQAVRAVQMSEIEVLLERPGCHRQEIIVTQKDNDKKVCLSPNGPQGKTLLKCWHKMQEKKEDPQKCIKRLRRQAQKKHSQKKHITSNKSIS